MNKNLIIALSVVFVLLTGGLVSYAFFGNSSQPTLSKVENQSSTQNLQNSSSKPSDSRSTPDSQGQSVQLGSSVKIANGPTATEVKVEPIITSVTKDTLATKNNREECWVSYKSVVYDVTSYVASHPGGVKAILEYCGKELDNIRNHPGGSFDGNSIQRLLMSRKVGDLQ